MTSNISKIKEKISNGGLPIGTIVSLSDPVISEILSYCGFDFIWIDGEHSSIDKKDIDLHIMAIRGMGLAPFVRVPWNDPVLVKPFLEMGPAAIIFPFIKTVEDAKLAVESCKYPPDGIRGFGPRRANQFSNLNINEYLTLSKKEPWVILQIEHIDGVNNLDKIIKVEGVDSIVVGPNDLAASVGLLGQAKHPEIIKLYNRIGKVCNEAEFPFGTSIDSSDLENINSWINRGISWLHVDTDVSLLTRGGKDCIEKIKNIYEK